MGAAIFNWLIAQGLWKSMVGAGVAVIVAHLFAWRPWRKFKADQKQHQEELVQQAQDVGTQTLHHVVEELARVLAEREHPHG